MAPKAGELPAMPNAIVAQSMPLSRLTTVATAAGVTARASVEVDLAADCSLTGASSRAGT